MKYITIYSGNNTIELHNSWLGKETIKVNDEIVSSNFSFWGTEHEFQIREDGVTKSCTITFGTGMPGVVFDFYKDGEPVVVSEKSGSMRFIIIIIILAVVISIAEGIWDLFE